MTLQSIQNSDNIFEVLLMIKIQISVTKVTKCKLHMISHNYTVIARIIWNSRFVGKWLHCNNYAMHSFPNLFFTKHKQQRMLTGYNAFAQCLLITHNMSLMILACDDICNEYASSSFFFIFGFKTEFAVPWNLITSTLYPAITNFSFYVYCAG